MSWYLKGATCSPPPPTHTHLLFSIFSVFDCPPVQSTRESQYYCAANTHTHTQNIPKCLFPSCWRTHSIWTRPLWFNIDSGNIIGYMTRNVYFPRVGNYAHGGRSSPRGLTSGGCVKLYLLSSSLHPFHRCTIINFKKRQFQRERTRLSRRASFCGQELRQVDRLRTVTTLLVALQEILPQ